MPVGFGGTHCRSLLRVRQLIAVSVPQLLAFDPGNRPHTKLDVVRDEPVDALAARSLTGDRTTTF